MAAAHEVGGGHGHAAVPDGHLHAVDVEGVPAQPAGQSQRAQRHERRDGGRPARRRHPLRPVRPLGVAEAGEGAPEEAAPRVVERGDEHAVPGAVLGEDAGQGRGRRAVLEVHVQAGFGERREQLGEAQQRLPADRDVRQPLPRVVAQPATARADTVQGLVVEHDELAVRRGAHVQLEVGEPGGVGVHERGQGVLPVDGGAPVGEPQRVAATGGDGVGEVGGGGTGRGRTHGITVAGTDDRVPAAAAGNARGRNERQTRPHSDHSRDRWGRRARPQSSAGNSSMGRCS